MEVAGLAQTEISVRTISRFFNIHGYFYLHDDLKTCVKFDKMCKKIYPSDFWTNKVAFYLDRTSVPAHLYPPEIGYPPVHIR